MIAQAQSGTGKTATFSVSVLQRVDEKKKETQALIMAPTRELAQQVRKTRIFLSLHEPHIYLQNLDPNRYARPR